MKTIPTIAATLAAATALSGCAIFNRGGDQPDRVAPEEGRISILALEQRLEADPELAGLRPVIPLAEPMPSWPLPGGTATNAPGNIAGGDNLRVAWRETIAEGSSRRERLSAPPVVLDGRLFVLSADQELRAVDAGSGRALWRADLRARQSKDKHAIGGGVAAADGRVYAVSGFGVAAAYDAATGQEIWRAVGAAPFAGAPTVGGGRVYAVTNDSELFAIDAATGQVLWTHQAIAEPARILAASSAAVTDEIVVSPFPSGEVIALLPANGRRLWVDGLSRAGRSTSLAAINDVAGRPVFYDGVVYAASHSGVIAAIDSRTGQRIWARAFGGSTQTPLVVGDALYIVSVDGELAALDRATGRAFWTAQLERYENARKRRGRIAWAGPLMMSGRLVLVSSVGEVAIVSPETGAVERTFEVDAEIFVPPVAADGAVYLLADNGRLIALR